MHFAKSMGFVRQRGENHHGSSACTAAPPEAEYPQGATGPWPRNHLLAEHQAMRTVLRVAEAIDEYGRPMVRRELRAGRWTKPARGVVVTHNGSLTEQEAQEVALCVCPPKAALAGLTALARDGLRGFPSDAIHIALPEGAMRPTHPALAPHWTRQLGDPHVRPGPPRRTRTPRSVVDAAIWTTSDRHARAIVLASVQQGLVTPQDVIGTAKRRGPVPRRALVIQSALDAGGGIQSLPERDFDDIRISARIPAPTRQRRVEGAGGRYFLDAEWEAWGAFVEVHGLPHHDVRQWDHDLLKGNELAIGGSSGLYFTSYAIRHEKAKVRDQLVRFLRSRGWDGP